MFLFGYSSVSVSFAGRISSLISLLEASRLSAKKMLKHILQNNFCVVGVCPEFQKHVNMLTDGLEGREWKKVGDDHFPAGHLNIRIAFDSNILKMLKLVEKKGKKSARFSGRGIQELIHNKCKPMGSPA